MTWDETFSQLSADWKTSSPNPPRMQELLSRLGHPEKTLHFIHIAGTNGKGSASAMTSRILTEAGYRTGLYISPHLLRINERWSVDGQDISDEDLSAMLDLLKPHIMAMTDKPTKFEILTALGFLYFKMQHCDVVVLEVGLGGRLDATNAIPVPDCAMIMSIGLEHTEILGDTIEKIALEKGGIIKDGSHVVLYPQEPAAEAVIRTLSETHKASLHVVDPSQLTEEPAFRNATNLTSDYTADLASNLTTGLASNLAAASACDSSCNCSPETVPVHAENASDMPRLLQYFTYKERKHVGLALLGDYQCRNACCVLEAMDVLREKGYDISEEAIRRGLKQVVWPGRFEVISTRPLCILDGAHNPNGVEALVHALRSQLPGYTFTFVIGVMADKNYHEMLRLAAPLANRFIAEVPDSGSDRGLHADALAAEIKRYFSGPVETAPNVTKALSRALSCLPAENTANCRTDDFVMDNTASPNPICNEFRQAVVCFGSLYQAAEVRGFFAQRHTASTPCKSNDSAGAID